MKWTIITLSKWPIITPSCHHLTIYRYTICGATTQHDTSHTNTMLPMRKSVKLQQAIGSCKDLLIRSGIDWYITCVRAATVCANVGLVSTATQEHVPQPTLQALLHSLQDWRMSIKGLTKTMLQSTVKGRRRQGGQRKGGRTTSRNRLARSSRNPRGQRRTGQTGESWL